MGDRKTRYTFYSLEHTHTHERRRKRMYFDGSQWISQCTEQKETNPTRKKNSSHSSPWCDLLCAFISLEIKVFLQEYCRCTVKRTKGEGNKLVAPVALFISSIQGCVVVMCMVQDCGCILVAHSHTYSPSFHSKWLYMFAYKQQRHYKN